MPYARVSAHDAHNASATTSVVATPSGATTAGNLLVAVVMALGTTSTVGTIAMSGWTLGLRVTSFSTTSDCALFWKISTGDSSATATATAATLMQIQMFEYTGNGPSPQIDASTSPNGIAGVTSRTTGTITTTVAGDLVVVWCAQNGTNGGTTSWTTATLLQADLTNELIVGQYLPGALLTTFGDTAHWTTSRQVCTGIVAFKPKPSGGLLGVF